MNRKHINSIIGGKAQRPILTVAAVLLAGGSATAGVVVKGSVYGGGNMANVGGNTLVSLTGGTIERDVYGGGCGTLETDADGKVLTETDDSGNKVPKGIQATVGNATVELNKDVASGQKGCVVEGSIFGCNNLNGSPLGIATVHVYGTQRSGKSKIIDKEYVTKTGAEYDFSLFDVKAVYGGGNLAAYVPTDALLDPEAEGNAAKIKAARTNVIIEGCDSTSIGQVYGGGNAASTPATYVEVNGTYELGELFGGGNGKDKVRYDDGTHEFENPGANVGYRNYTVYTKNDEGEYVTADATDADTKQKRLSSSYCYGSGEANVNIKGGKIHSVFGGSNTKGNVRITAVTMLEEVKTLEDGEEVAVCDLRIDEAYGGGKSAPMDAEAKLLMACIPGLSSVYGGAEAADVQGGVTLNITNGTFDRVFGGNNISGTINGPIVVNIEETGCRQIVIGQLYGGGNQAPYTGPLKTGSTTERQGPTLNVRSFTSIGEIYGGGYGMTAVVTGDTEVNINVCDGKYSSTAYTENTKPITFSEYRRKEGTGDASFVTGDDGNRIVDNQEVSVLLPGHDEDAIGAIGNVYGGGNAAKVIGNTNVNIGTQSTVNFATDDEDTADVDESTTPQTVKGVDIRGNVYGGGNQADVTGSTNVVIGKETTTTTP